MTREELKAQSTPIIIAQCNGASNTGQALLPLVQQWMHAGLEEGKLITEIMNEYNLVMAEIVEEHGLGRH